MDKIIFEFPVRIAVEFTGRNTTYANIWSLFTTLFFAPFYAKLSGKFGDVFVIFEICPEFNARTGLFF